MSTDHVLETLAPAIAWEPDWQDVLARAELDASPRLITKRRLILALAVLVLIAVPFVAYAAANQWWFLSGGAPTPVTAPIVVKEGEWSGHAWQLVAYRSTTDGLCLAVTPKGADLHGEGAAMECAPIAGVPRTANTKASPDMTITYLSSAATIELPAYIVGPVVSSASEVEIRFTNGAVLSAPTFPGPHLLGDVRFYAIQLPASLQPKPRNLEAIGKVFGLSAGGNIVACLVPKTAVNGVSALSDCR